MSALEPLAMYTHINMVGEVEKAVRGYKKHHGIADETPVYVEVALIMNLQNDPIVQIQVGGQPDPEVLEEGRLQ